MFASNATKAVNTQGIHLFTVLVINILSFEFKWITSEAENLFNCVSTLKGMCGLCMTSCLIYTIIHYHETAVDFMNGHFLIRQLCNAAICVSL